MEMSEQGRARLVVRSRVGVSHSLWLDVQLPQISRSGFTSPPHPTLYAVVERRTLLPLTHCWPGARGRSLVRALLSRHNHPVDRDDRHRGLVQETQSCRPVRACPPAAPDPRLLSCCVATACPAAPASVCGSPHVCVTGSWSRLHGGEDGGSCL